MIDYVELKYFMNRINIKESVLTRNILLNKQDIDSRKNKVKPVGWSHHERLQTCLNKRERVNV